jgi:antitoxin component YwqK of YwqJK toxin-antitoxin module
MKFLLLVLVLFGLLFGCGDDGEEVFPEIENPLDSAKLREDVFAKALELSTLFHSEYEEPFTYTGLDGQPYSGWVKKTYPSGQVGFLFECKNGKQDGLHTAWFESGAKMVERTWKAGLADGPFIAWRADGQVDYRGYNKANFLDGKFEEFYSRGRKKSEFQYKEGKIRQALRWKPDGTACPYTNLKDGTGMIVYYNDDDNVSIDYNETYANGGIDYGGSTAEVVPESVLTEPSNPASSGDANESVELEGNESTGVKIEPEVNSTAP